VSGPIDFYFEFGNPYSYIAANKLEGFPSRNGKKVNWRPILQLALHKMLEKPPLTPAELAYEQRDAWRTARQLRMPLNWPSTFPVNTIAAARAYYWVEQNYDEEKATQFAVGIFKAYWVTDHNIGDADFVLNVAERYSIDSAAMYTGINEQAIKDRLHQMTDVACQRGVLDTPTVFVGDEMFQGAHSIDQMERWAQVGGWS
jgi:2-hydroxychromene-2-carboxylate isomerase